MLSFSKKDFQNFIKLKNIKDSSSKIEDDLIKKTIKYLNFIKWIPGIKMVGIGNSVSMNNANNQSDIDLFIITSEKRMWIVRIIITIIFQMFGVKKTKKKHKSMFCLSFFCTTKSMNFKNIAIENDIYLYFWIIYLKPILNFENTYENFINENKKWCDFNDYDYIIKNNQKYIRYFGTEKAKKSKILNLLDNLIKKIFIKKTLKNYEKLGKPFGIIINDTMLKFHNNDKRKEIRDLINQ